MNGIEVSFTHDDRTWVLRHSELTAIDERDCRKETGFTISEVLGLLAETKPGLDTVAALEWLARRQNGERDLTYVAVAETITNASNLDVDWSVPDQEAEVPE